MKINIETIPHDQHRYPTVGDWYLDDQGTLVIRVSELGDWRQEFLIAIHELVEWAKCKYDGVTQEKVDEFDMEYEKNRESALNDLANPPEVKALIEIAEPGDDSAAPYRKQHCLATGIERIMAAELEVPWDQYEQKIESLP